MKTFENCYTFKRHGALGDYLTLIQLTADDGFSFRDCIRCFGIEAKDFRHKVFRYRGMIIVINDHFMDISDAENEIDKIFDRERREAAIPEYDYDR